MTLGDPVPQTTDTPSPRGSLALLLDPVFGRFFLGKLVSTAGIWIHNIVAVVLAYELTRSAFMVGMVSVAQFGPQAMLAPLSGALADRGNRREQLVVGRLVVASGSAGLAIWIWLVGVDGHPGAWPIVGAAFVNGIGFVIGGPAMHSLVPSLVRPSELSAAVALDSIPFTVARAGGPAAGAFIAASAGPVTAFALAAAGNLFFAAMVLKLPISAPMARSLGADGTVRAGLRYLRTNPTLILLLVGVGAVGVGTDPAITLAPSLSARMGRHADLVGLFASSFGAGAGLTFVYLSRVRRWLGVLRLGSVGLCMISIGLLALIPSRTAAAAAFAFATAGTGMTLALTSFSTNLQERLPEAMRGRIMALWSVAFIGTRPLTAAVNGGIADVFSVDVALVLVAVVVLGAAWLCRPSRLRSSPSGVL